MKKSRYANIVSHGGRALIHNTLFGGVVKSACDASTEFLEKLATLDNVDVESDNEFHNELMKLRMIVDDDIDESNLVHYYYTEYLRHELFVIPVVTRQCNFRCVYCYEKHENKIMQSESYDRLYKSIEQAIDAKGYKVLRVSFFGGEPLLELDAIYEFAKRLKALAIEKKITFIGHITTNAYLLTYECFEKLVSVNVTGYQITIDGTKETHDVARPLVSGAGTWDVIMQNMIAAKESDLSFQIMLRTNLSESIMTQSHEYLAQMASLFKDDKRFQFHFEAVKKLKPVENDPLKILDDEPDAINKMTEEAISLGLSLSNFLTRIIPFRMICYAGKSDSVIIDTDGTVMKCTVHIDDDLNKVGLLTDEGALISDFKMAHWTAQALYDRCYSCDVLPICYGKSCPAVAYQDNRCDDLIQIYLVAIYMFAHAPQLRGLIVVF